MEDQTGETSRGIHASVLGVQFVEIVGHANNRMKERGVSDQDVIAALKSPSKTGLPTQPGRERVRWNKTARVAVDVVYERLSDRIRVITTMRGSRRVAGRG